MVSEPLKLYDEHADNPPWLKALAEVRHRATREGWRYAHVQAIIVAIFSYWIWYNMMRRYPVNQVMPFTLLLPMVGFICGAAILGDEITWRMMVGALATVAGVAIIVLRRPSVLAPSTKTGI